MIYLYSGKIGDGKTYHVVENELIPALRKKRRVYTNIDGLQKRPLARLAKITEDEIDIVFLETVEEVRELLKLEPNDKEGRSLKLERGSVVLLDEAQMYYDAREFKETPKEFLSLLEYHRHFGLDFVFITQSPKRLDSAIRALTNECYQVKNLGFLAGFLGSQYIINVRQGLKDEIHARIKGKFKQEVFQCYASSRAQGVRTHEVPSFLKQKAGFLGFLLLAVVGTLIYSGRQGAYAKASRGEMPGTATEPNEKKTEPPAEPAAKLREKLAERKVGTGAAPNDWRDTLRCGYEAVAGKIHFEMEGYETVHIEKPKLIEKCEAAPAALGPAPAGERGGLLTPTKTPAPWESAVK